MAGGTGFVWLQPQLPSDQRDPVPAHSQVDCHVVAKKIGRSTGAAQAGKGTTAAIGMAFNVTRTSTRKTGHTAGAAGGITVRVSDRVGAAMMTVT